MTNSNEVAAADQAAFAAHLLTLVNEMRALRDRTSQQSGRVVTFAEIARVGVTGGRAISSPGDQFLLDLAEILDANKPTEVDSDLAKQWRTAVHAWLAKQS